ncbi:hypothetical protein [Candidiatus Paracoxiella cheracis]|uniref:hypothetical protein n=1 Tax=Candidiatus Paracoxiella cheracis TaxID=3405120 RepID=UPI003BF5AB51
MRNNSDSNASPQHTENLILFDLESDSKSRKLMQALLEANKQEDVCEPEFKSRLGEVYKEAKDELLNLENLSEECKPQIDRCLALMRRSSRGAKVIEDQVKNIFSLPNEVEKITLRHELDRSFTVIYLGFLVLPVYCNDILSKLGSPYLNSNKQPFTLEINEITSPVPTLDGNLQSAQQNFRSYQTLVDVDDDKFEFFDTDDSFSDDSFSDDSFSDDRFSDGLLYNDQVSRGSGTTEPSINHFPHLNAPQNTFCNNVINCYQEFIDNKIEENGRSINNILERLGRGCTSEPYVKSDTLLKNKNKKYEEFKTTPKVSRDNKTVTLQFTSIVEAIEYLEGLKQKHPGMAFSAKGSNQNDSNQFEWQYKGDNGQLHESNSCSSAASLSPEESRPSSSNQFGVFGNTTRSCPRPPNVDDSNGSRSRCVIS